MQSTKLLTVLLVVIAIAEGRTYGYGKRDNVVKPILGNPKIVIPEKKANPCPPVACTLEAIPIKCREKTYFIKDGVKCEGCDKDICIDRFNQFDGKWNSKSIDNNKELVNNFPRKGVDVVEVPVPVPVRVPVSSSPLLGFPSNNVRPLDPSPNQPSRQGFPIPDPVAFVNSPPSDSEFANRLRFDTNNLNLFSPPLDANTASNFQNSFQNQNRQSPLQHNFPTSFPNQPNWNPWLAQGLTNSNIPNGPQDQANWFWQSQVAAAQIEAQQTAQLQAQQSLSQLQGLQPSVANGMSQNTQGFPSWGLNPNPFMNGIQQQQWSAQNVGFQPGINTNNQIPPLSGINTDFQANNWATGPGPFNSASSNFPSQNSQGLSIFDPITNQELSGGSNSLHGPIN